MTQPYEPSLINADATLNDLRKRVAELEERLQEHTGDAQGSAGQFYPHPIQSIDTAEYGGGAERLDSTGIQLKVGTSFTTAIFWPPTFPPRPLLFPPITPSVLTSVLDLRVHYRFTLTMQLVQQ